MRNSQIIARNLTRKLNFRNVCWKGGNENGALEIARKKNKDVAEALIHAGADIHSKDGQGNTPLMKACKWGHVDVAKMLVEAGANINKINEYEQTALIIACKEGHQGTVQILVAAGVDANAKTEDG